MNHGDQHRRARERYDRTFAAVRSVINRHDPMGLMGGECPIDEYDPEVAPIVAAVLRASDAESLADVIERVFAEQFGVLWRCRGEWVALAEDVLAASRASEQPS